ncbi:MAG TPA: hypothetical protein VLC08_13475 [Chitinolyticbacter sp.]|nr:hypothetical protein [Chitinolyticbacter sp.]
MAVDPILAVNRQPDRVAEVLDTIELQRLARIEAQARAQRVEEIEQAQQATATDPAAATPPADDAVVIEPFPNAPLQDAPVPDDALAVSTLAFARSRGVAGLSPEALARENGTVPPETAQALLARAALNDVVQQQTAVTAPQPDPLAAALLHDRLDQASTHVQPFMVYGVAVNGANPVVSQVGVAVDPVGPVDPTPAVPKVEAALDTPADPLRIRDSYQRR